MSKSRNWCFTVNNPSGESGHSQLDFGNLRVKYAIWQLEVGVNGTQHYQGYCELRNAVTLGGIKRAPGLARAHLEIRRGTRDEARDYCRKDSGRVEGPWELGTWSGQGARSDLAGICADLQAGNSLDSIREAHSVQYLRYRRGFQDLAGVAARKKARVFRMLQVSVYWGAAGSGKTRKAVEESEESGYYFLDQAEKLWFDGYEGEGTLIIDDFYGWIKYGILLRILDGYQFRCEIKGGFTYALWTRVIITSNKHPSEWYANGLTPALERRINNILHFE